MTDDMQTLEATIDDLGQRIDAFVAETARILVVHQRLLTAARAFVVKFEAARPGLDNAFAFQQIHGGQYTGPSFADELAALELAIADAEAVGRGIVATPVDVTVARTRIATRTRLDVVGTEGGKATTESRS